MEHTIRATDLARNLGDVLSRVRYRRDSFVVRRYGRPVARVVPIEDETEGATVGEALSNWCGGAESDPAFADDLDVINASDRPRQAGRNSRRYRCARGRRASWRSRRFGHPAGVKPHRTATRSAWAHQAAIRLRSRAISHRACSHSHPSALPHPAISRRTAIAGLIAQCPWITLDSWTGVTPSRAAAAAIVRSPPCRAASRPTQPSAIAHPGCGGSRRMTASCLAGISVMCAP